MLCRFTVANYKSFDGEAVLDMLDADGGPLPAACVCGANSCGKSVLVEALSRVCTSVSFPVALLAGGTVRAGSVPEGVVPMPFAPGGAHEGEPSRYEAVFRSGGLEFTYRLAETRGSISSESLVARAEGSDGAEQVFSREEGAVELCARLRRSGVRSLFSFNPAIPYLAFLRMNTADEAVAAACGWLSACSFPGLADRRFGVLAERALGDGDFDRAAGFLRGAGVDVAGFRASGEGDRRRVYAVHRAGAVEFETRLAAETGGVSKLAFLAGHVLDALESGGLVAVDDLGEGLHPDVVGWIVGLFCDPRANAGGAQLLFTSHGKDLLGVGGPRCGRFVCSRDARGASAIEKEGAAPARLP